jgi:hypothetical protein
MLASNVWYSGHHLCSDVHEARVPGRKLKYGIPDTIRNFGMNSWRTEWQASWRPNQPAGRSRDPDQRFPGQNQR